MKKLLSLMLALALLVMVIPVAAHASSVTEIINSHGTKTYMGTSSDWSATFDADNFEDVTGKDIDYSDGSLEIRGGRVGDVEVSGSSYNLHMSGGSAASLKADNEIYMSGGTVKENVETTAGLTLSSSAAINGNASGKKVTVTSSSDKHVTVGGTLSADTTITLNGRTSKIKTIDGKNSATLECSSFTGDLPQFKNLSNIKVESNSTVNTANAIEDLDMLTIASGSNFSAESTIDVGMLVGPGTLTVKSGKLTVETDITEKPILNLGSTCKTGAIAFRTKPGCASGGDITVYGYDLTKSSSGDYDVYSLTSSSGDGVTLNKSSVTVSGSSPAIIKATVKPSMSEFGDNTDLKWELIDPDSKFYITGNNKECTVYLKDSKTVGYKASVVCYLKDSNGDRLTGYKSDVCSVTSVSSSSSASNTSYNNNVYSVSLDTSNAMIPAGSTYCVLAVTGANTAPAATSYNSSVATVGKATKYNYNGKSGWLYPIAARSAGGVTVNIGGEKVIITVKNDLSLDSASAYIAKGKTYKVFARTNSSTAPAASSYNSAIASVGKAVKYTFKGKRGWLIPITAKAKGSVTVAIGGQKVITTVY